MIRSRFVRAATLFLAILALAALVGVSLVTDAAAAQATPSPSPAAPASSPATPSRSTPTPSRPSATPSTVSPTIDSPPPGTFVGKSTTTIEGTRGPGQELQLLSPLGGDPLCIVAAGPATDWSCDDVPLPDGQGVRLRVVVTGSPTLSDEITIDVLGAPSVTGGPRGTLASNGTVRGSAYPNASVIAALATSERCTATADTAGAWSCSFAGPLANGAVAVTAAQQTPFSYPSSSNSSDAVELLIDTVLPAAPTVSTPVAGARVPLEGAAYAGTGEDGATVTVFAGPYSLCSVVVAGGAWNCFAGGVAAGSYLVIAAQQDAAGNLGPGSPGLAVDFGPAPAPPPSAGPGSPTAAPAPSPGTEPTTQHPPAPADGVPPAPSPTPTAPTPSPTAPAPGNAAGPRPPTTLPGGWNDPTNFATAVLPPGSNAELSWLQAALLAVFALVLLFIPARLLGGTIASARNGRPLFTGAVFSGRNRAREEFETAPEVAVNRSLLAGAAFAAAATLIMLSGPVTSQPAYLRLLLAVVIALVVVNAVGALVPLWWSVRVFRVQASVTFLPRYLLLVAVAALASRAAEIHPALLFGLLGSVMLPAGGSTARRGQLAAVRAGGLLLLALIGWLVLGVLPAAAGFAGLLAAEIANSVVLTAIGSALFVLIPIGSTTGRSILAWSPAAWAGLTLSAFTIMFAVLGPVVGLWQGAGLAWFASVVFAALSVGAWAWQRFVAAPTP